MNAVEWTDVGVVSLVEIPEPSRVPGWVLVRPSYAGICGSDLSIIAGKHARATRGTIIGHEFSGTVAAVGAGSQWAPGRAVAVNPLIACVDRGDGPCEACSSGNPHVCRRLGLYGVDEPGGFADLVAVRESALYALPPLTAPHLAGLVEPLSVAVHAVDRATPAADDLVVVYGGGPIGLLVALVARQRSGARIVIVEPSAWRRSVAEQYGFQTAPDADATAALVADLSGGVGADIVFDSAGHPSVAAQVTDIARIRGTVVVVGVYAAPPAIDLRAVNFKEQTIVGTRVYTREAVADAIALLDGDALDLAALPVRVHPLAKVAEAFDAARAGDACIKSMVALDATDITDEGGWA